MYPNILMLFHNTQRFVLSKIGNINDESVFKEKIISLSQPVSYIISYITSFSGYYFWFPADLADFRRFKSNYLRQSVLSAGNKSD